MESRQDRADVAERTHATVEQPVAPHDTSAPAPGRPQVSTTLALEGMSCASCALRIEKGLKKVPGVSGATVNFATERASVHYDPMTASIDQLLAKVEAVGYKATPVRDPTQIAVEAAPRRLGTFGAPKTPAAETTEVTSELAISGMTCASCARRIERALAKAPGVATAAVNLATERATVTYNTEQVGVAALIAAVERAGYGATALGEADRAGTTQATATEGSTPIEATSSVDAQRLRRDRELEHKRNTLLLGSAFSVPVVLLSMFFMNRFPGENLLLLALTVPVWGYVGWDFHRTTLRVLRHFGANMDVLISLGSTAAFLMSVVATFFPGWWAARPSMTPPR
jgi:Cu+-exporting ATPase